MLSIAVVVLCVIVSSPAIFDYCYRKWEIGEQFDECTFEMSTCDLRITANHQRGTFLGAPGGFYKYEVKAKSDAGWKQIAIFRLSRPDRIPRNQVHQVSDNIIYFFQDYVFGVTTNGVSWSLSGGGFQPISSDLSDEFALIETVSIDPSGIGFMRLSSWAPDSDGEPQSIVLDTTDGGLTWKRSGV